MPRTENFDYVIVGAGSAGCVLANQLSEDPDTRVLLLEAGPMDKDLMIHIPAGVYKVYKDSRLNWNYWTQKQTELRERSVEMPRGKVVGGSSSINSMVYMRGHPLDYDRWAEDFDLPDWRFSNCLPYFKAGESCDRDEDDWRGTKGRLGVTRGHLENPLFDAFLEAGKQSGQGHSEDLNGYQPEGLARLDSTRKNGRRCSAAVAHLHPALKRPNLFLKTSALVQKITTEGQRATGIIYQHKGKTYQATVNNEVILSGGAINSPQLLMLSGIGPEEHLRKMKIPIVHNLPGVGQNLQDHASVAVVYACKKPVTIDYLANPFYKAWAGLRWLANRSGPASSNIWEAGGLVKGNSTVPYPNLQYHYGPIGVEYDGNKILLSQAFSLYIDQLRPTSSGHIELLSTDHTEHPRLFFNYLSTDHDCRELVEGIKMARDLVAQPAYDEFRGEETDPGRSLKTDAELLDYVRKTTVTDYHPCGTCRMGTDPMAVVDGQFRVHGIEGLRVVDASTMPRVISANLNAPTQMMAARAADFIRGRRQLGEINARFHFQ
ncbi:MAG: choline dehydrogenase [Gammaproteobacteria bacterium]|jgi:choline dehydrogenase